MRDEGRGNERDSIMALEAMTNSSGAACSGNHLRRVERVAAEHAAPLGLDILIMAYSIDIPPLRGGGRLRRSLGARRLRRFIVRTT